jgi:hypothetical protein
MADVYDKLVEVSKHKRLKRSVESITLVKKNKTKISAADIITAGEVLLKKNPTKKLMIKVLSDKGFFQLKGYNDSIESISTEEEYILGREDIGKTSFYKVTFYLT